MSSSRCLPQLHDNFLQELYRFRLFGENRLRAFLVFVFPFLSHGELDLQNPEIRDFYAVIVILVITESDLLAQILQFHGPCCLAIDDLNRP
jgi:hypothetical protein